MSIAKKETKKLFYQIGEVAKELDVNVSLIRFWEKEFDIIKPKKNKKGNRLFTQKDFDNLKTIYFLVKERGYTLDGAKRKIKDNAFLEWEEVYENQFYGTLKSEIERISNLGKTVIFDVYEFQHGRPALH